MAEYKYSITNTLNDKRIKNEVNNLPFVTGCKIKNGVITVCVYDECEENSVFSNIKQITINYGVSVSKIDEIINPEIQEKCQNKSIIDENVENNNKDCDEIQDGENNVAKIKFFAPKDETLTERKKDHKSDSILRLCELTASLILLVVAYFIPGSMTSFGAKTILYIVSFAISGYDVFYSVVKSIIKRQIFSPSFLVIISLITAVIFWGLDFSALLSFGYAVFLATQEFLQVKIKQKVEEISNRENSENLYNSFLSKVQNKKITKILYFVSLLLTLSPFLFFIPSLSMYNDAIALISVAFVFISILEQVFGFVYAYKCAKLYTSGITIYDEKTLEKVAKSNAFCFKASALTDGGVVLDDSIGAVKELISLGAKSLKTDFDIQLSDDERKKIDFKDKDFKNKKVCYVGSGLDVSFDLGSITICDKDIKKVPYLFKVAKRILSAKRRLALLYVLDILCCVGAYLGCGVFGINYLTILCGALGYIFNAVYLLIFCLID